jgi:hypothetical protein
MPEPDKPNPLLHDRLADWGPRYTETPSGEPPFSLSVAEPWNTVSAALFIVLVLIWIGRVRGIFRQLPFFSCCLPILLVGGIGGTLFHATRASPIFFLLDIVPIYGLGLLVALFLWIRLGPRLSYLLGMVACLGLLQIWGQWQLPTQWAVNLSYGSLALIVLLPLGLLLVRSRFRHAQWIYASLSFFVLAWVCRITDVLRPLPMGTHWLWHLFGAATTWTLGEYIYRVEGEATAPGSSKPSTEATLRERKS